MREFGILYDNGLWHVMEKFDSVAPAQLVMSCASWEIAIEQIGILHGGPVLVKVTVEPL